MANLETGIARYVHASAVVRVSFPVDFRGHAFICCEQCFFFKRSYQTCSLNGEVCQFPSKFVGGSCPLILEEGEDESQD